MKLHEIKFRRRFSVNPYRSLRLNMGRMDFFKNWVDDRRGDPYPILRLAGEVKEHVADGKYAVDSSSGGSVCRLLGSFFPWNTYEFTIDTLKGASVGILLCGDGGEISVVLQEDRAVVICSEKQVEFQAQVQKNAVFAVTFRTGGISLYLNHTLLGDVPLKTMHAYRKEHVFEHASVFVQTELQAGGRCALSGVEWYLCGGISHADIKPIRYEDGTPLIEGGRVFLTVSSRTEAEMYQSVISWNPTLCDFRMEGALFFDVGDGEWCSDVASSVIYDRGSARWLIWMCTFSHGHVLARGVLHEDPRFGVQVIDVRPMERVANASLTDFVGIEGDEDPDLLYCNGKWHLAICRVEPQTGYHYYHLVSDDPLDGFTFADRTPTGEKTGGLFVKTEDGYCFVCGSDFGSRARYDVYPLEDFSTHERLQCDYDDGGFRGWGSVMLLPFGGRRRYVWITFDRHNASSYNWSYGNLYVFDSDYIKRET